MLKIGLTGGIATGKSTVEKFFRDLGVPVIDADEIVHKLLKEERIKKKLVEILGDVLDENGEIDRKKVANIIFSNIEKKKQVENVIHPEVFKYIQNWIKEQEHKNPKGFVIISVPLMIETGSYKNYDKIIVVYAPKEVQLKRLLKKGMTKEEALKRINAQMDIEEKLKYADFVINNTGTLQDLKKEVEKVYKELEKMAYNQ
jgi:dephospho-CoA kinase